MSHSNLMENRRVTTIQLFVNLVVLLKDQGIITEEEMKVIFMEKQEETIGPMLVALLVLLKDKGIITEEQMKAVLEA